MVRRLQLSMPVGWSLQRWNSFEGEIWVFLLWVKFLLILADFADRERLLVVLFQQVLRLLRDIRLHSRQALRPCEFLSRRASQHHAGQCLVGREISGRWELMHNGSWGKDFSFVFLGGHATFFGFLNTVKIITPQVIQLLMSEFLFSLSISSFIAIWCWSERFRRRRNTSDGGEPSCRSSRWFSSRWFWFTPFSWSSKTTATSRWRSFTSSAVMELSSTSFSCTSWWVIRFQCFCANFNS